jgi:hypothetical protein
MQCGVCAHSRKLPEILANAKKSQREPAVFQCDVYYRRQSRQGRSGFFAEEKEEAESDQSRAEEKAQAIAALYKR